MRWLLALACGVALAELTVPLGLDPHMHVPKDSPLTREVVLLGRRLFQEKALSRDGTIACQTCHEPHLAFADGKALAEGIDQIKGPRSSPTLINRGYGATFFWDGRAASLEQQALQPILSVVEMDTRLDEIVPKLGKAGYAASFRAVFHRELNNEDVARALASYVRTIRSGNSPFDRHIAGEPRSLTTEEQRGLDLFSSKARCWFCHTGLNFTDELFHNTGVAYKEGKFADRGRAEISRNRADLGAFKTPTLREIARTAPYMHDGSLATLDDVIEFYDRGGVANPNLDKTIQPLHLTPAEKRELLAFLRALSGQVREGW